MGKKQAEDLGIKLMNYFERRLRPQPSIDSLNAVENKKNTECYVYLMKDTANGRYKIGMSNKPEYREKTLQSEKPEIILICAKKYDSRDEARLVEKELHLQYKRNRIRGEWFNLSDYEVENITMYLGQKCNVRYFINDELIEIQKIRAGKNKKKSWEELRYDIKKRFNIDIDEVLLSR